MNQFFQLTGIAGQGGGPYITSPCIIEWNTTAPATDKIDLYWGNGSGPGGYFPIALGVPNTGLYVWRFDQSAYLSSYARFQGQGQIGLVDENPLYAAYWTSSWDFMAAWLYLAPPVVPVGTGATMQIDSITPNSGGVGATVNIAGSGFSLLNDPTAGFSGDGYGDGMWMTFTGTAQNPYFGTSLSGTFSGALGAASVTDTLVLQASLPSLLCMGSEVGICTAQNTVVTPPGIYQIYFKSSHGTNVSNSVPFYLGVAPPPATGQIVSPAPPSTASMTPAQMQAMITLLQQQLAAK